MNEDQDTSRRSEHDSLLDLSRDDQCFFRFSEALISFRSVGRSMSDKCLIYKQPFPVLCFPSFDNKSGSPPSPNPMYKVRFCLRGENPTNGQSASLPPAYLIFLLPNPAMLLPHMTPLLFVAVSISFAIAEQSALVCASGRLLMKSVTLCFVGLVFASANPSLFCRAGTLIEIELSINRILI